MKADIEDIERELWLRRRNADELIWTTKDGQSIPIREMTTQHLENCLKHFNQETPDENIW